MQPLFPYLVFEQSNERRSLALAKKLGLRTVTLEAGPSEAFEQPAAIIIDVDLAQLEKATRIRRMLKRNGPSGLLLFAVDGGSKAHISRVQADALGATRVLRRPLTPEQILSTLRELGIQLSTVPSAGSATEELGAPSIAAASLALDGAFKSLAAGAALDIRAAVDAGRQLLAGVGTAGLASWLDTVRAHHSGTYQHCLLVTGAATAFGQKAGLAQAQQRTLIMAALLHDIGKAEIPLEILDKAGRLSDDEFEVIKQHPVIGQRYLLQQKATPPEIISAVAHHHEYLDGSGYPDGLSGDQIDALTRILTVCDVYGALVERRAYKEPKSPAEAILILVDMARRGKVEYRIVRTLGAAVDVKLREEGHWLG